MEMFFRKYFLWLQQRIKKYLSHHHRFRSFFSSKVIRLTIIIVLALAIPLTVLGVQQVQEIRQQAKVAQLCDGSKLLNANPRPVTHGEKITFSHTDGPITQQMFENEDFLGNGVFPDNDKQGRKCVYDSANGWIVCTAKGNPNAKTKDASGNRISDHTWTFRGVECNYQVLYPKDPEPTGKKKPKPTSTPKPTSVNGKCDRDIKAECDARNKPRLRIKWTVEGSGKTCKIYLQEATSPKVLISTECDRNTSIFPNDDFTGTLKEIQNNTQYTLIVENDSSCKNQSAAVVTSCGARVSQPPPPANTTPTKVPFVPPGTTTPGVGGPPGQPQPTQSQPSPGTTGKGTCANGKGTWSIQGVCQNGKTAYYAVWDIPEVLGPGTCNIYWRSAVGEPARGASECKGAFTFESGQPAGSTAKLIVSNGDPNGGCYNVESTEAKTPTNCSQFPNTPITPQPTTVPTPTLDPKKCQAASSTGQQATAFDPRCPTAVPPTPKPTAPPAQPTTASTPPPASGTPTACSGTPISLGYTKELLPLPNEKGCSRTFTGACGRPGSCTTPQKIVLHVTAGSDTSSASDIKNFFANGSPGPEGLNGVGAHFAVDQKGNVVQMVESLEKTIEVAYAVKNYSDHISIEMVSSKVYRSKNNVPAAQYAATLALVKKLMQQYKIPKGNLEYNWNTGTDAFVEVPPGVYGHYQLNPKSREDPGAVMQDFLKDL